MVPVLVVYGLAAAPPRGFTRPSFAIAASARCPVPKLVASPSPDLTPAAVVEAQLNSLQQGDVRGCYEFSSPANRQNTGPWQMFESMVRRTPVYNLLLGCSRFEVLSALAVGPERWTCRVRVRPSEASLRCLGRTARLRLGQRVRLTRDAQHLARAFETVDYEWSELMEGMLGQEYKVLQCPPQSRSTQVVGLPSPDGSQDGVWFFPVTAIERADADSEDAAATEKARTINFRWEVSRQPETAVAMYDVGMLLQHKSSGYRGVIVGYDKACRQSEEWITKMGVDNLHGGRSQPFYHVLVDRRDRPNDQVTYVAEENIQRPATGLACEPVAHKMIDELLLPDSFDAERRGYEPRAELRALYPTGVRGCWMVDSVLPDIDANIAGS